MKTKLLQLLSIFALCSLISALPASAAQYKIGDKAVTALVNTIERNPTPEQTAQINAALETALKDPGFLSKLQKFDEARNAFMADRKDAKLKSAYSAAQEAVTAQFKQFLPAQQPAADKKSPAKPTAKSTTPKDAAKPATTGAADSSSLRILSAELWNPAGLTPEETEKMTAALDKAAQQPAVIAITQELKTARSAHQENRRRYPQLRDPSISANFNKVTKQATATLRDAMIAADPSIKPLFEKSKNAPKLKKNEGENATDSDTGNKAAMAPVTDDPKLPRVLLIGDSISIGYTVQVRQKLAGIANVHRVPQNAGATEVGLANIKTWLGNKHWDVIHFNFGLHDAKYANPTEQRASREQYIKNLQELIDIMRKAGATHLIFANTTPIPDMLKFGIAKNSRVFDSIEARNELAAELMKKNNVAINDVYTLVKNNPGAGRDHDVHFTPEGYDLLSTAVADAIKKSLQK